MPIFVKQFKTNEMKKYKYEFSILIEGKDPIDITLTAKNERCAWAKLNSILNNCGFAEATLQNETEVEL